MPAPDPATEIALLQAQLAAARADVQEFSYTVSHDLRANLRHILAYADLLQEDAGPVLNGEMQAHLNAMTGAARHMGALMDGLMEFSRVGTVPLQPVAVPLDLLVQEVCQQLQAQHPERTIVWQVAADLPQVRVDVALLRQVWSHVLGNAVKFSAPRAQTVIGIHWQAGPSPALCTVQVRDKGVGFNTAHTDKLFHVFQRLHSQREFEGIGMGLALTRKILERHDCTVWAEGAADAGCTVGMTLPVVL